MRSNFGLSRLAECESGVVVTLGEGRVDNEEALRLIRSCEASSVISLHSGDWLLTLRSDKTLLIPQPDPDALTAAARKAMERGCNMAIGTE